MQSRSVFAIAFLLPAAAAAQEAFVASEGVVVSASRAQLPARAVGSAVTVVTREQIERSQSRRVADVLQDIPGVRVDQTRRGQVTGVSIRGSGANRVLVLVDGIRLADPSIISSQFTFDHLTSLDVERIEVLRGNQSSLYGSDAIGGVINIVTRRAPQDGFLLNAEAEGGSYGTAEGGASAFWRNDVADFRLTAFGARSDGPNLTDPETAFGPAREDDGYSSYGLSGRAGFQFTPDLALDMTGLYAVSDTDLDGFFADSADTVEKDEYAIGGRLTWDMLDGRLSHEVSASRYTADRTFYTAFGLPQGDDYEGTLTRFGYAATARPLDFATVVAGASWEKEETDQLTAFSGAFDADVETSAVFGEIAVEPLDGLTLTAAGRLDDNTRFGDFDTYRLTAAYFFGVTEDLDAKLRASFGTGAKAPSLYQLFDPQFGNANLEVEESEGWDVGVDLYWDAANLAFEATYFRNDITNEIGFGPRADLGGASGYIQFGQTEAEGVELGLTAQPHEWVRLGASHTWLVSQNGETDRWLGRPRHAGAATVTFGPVEKWSVGARARYATENASGFGGVTDDYATVDLLGTYRLSEEVELFGRVENLLDADYQTVWGQYEPGVTAFAGLRVSLGGGF